MSSEEVFRAGGDVVDGGVGVGGEGRGAVDGAVAPDDGEDGVVEVRGRGWGVGRAVGAVGGEGGDAEASVAEAGLEEAGESECPARAGEGVVEEGDKHSRKGSAGRRRVR